MPKKNFIVALTGASGVGYGLRFLYHLAKLPIQVNLIFSPVFWRIAHHELNCTSEDFLTELKRCYGLKNEEIQWEFFIHPHKDVGASIASGSFLHSGMVIIPCSMKTMAAIAQGYTANLIERAADVSLKERRKLILVIRETPYSLIHLENMKKLTLAGALVLPASPGFYHKPQKIEQLYDFICDRVFMHLEVENRLLKPWTGEE